MGEGTFQFVTDPNQLGRHGINLFRHSSRPLRMAHGVIMIVAASVNHLLLQPYRLHGVQLRLQIPPLLGWRQPERQASLNYLPSMITQFIVDAARHWV